MSNAPTVTASVEPDLTLGNDDEIANWTCTLLTTCANGTPLCPTSFHQEDMVVICKGLGLECPKGVLWLTDMETVLVFQSNSEKMATMHCLTVAMVWE